MQQYYGPGRGHIALRNSTANSVDESVIHSHVFQIINEDSMKGSQSLGGGETDKRRQELEFIVPKSPDSDSMRPGDMRHPPALLIDEGNGVDACAASQVPC